MFYCVMLVYIWAQTLDLIYTPDHFFVSIQCDQSQDARHATEE